MKNAADYRNGKTLKEVFKFAQKKAAVLKNRQMIRLFADVDFGFYLFKESNVVYIGSCCDGSDKEMPKFFKNKEVIDMDDAEGTTIMKMQRLFKKNVYHLD